MESIFFRNKNIEQNLDEIKFQAISWVGGDFLKDGEEGKVVDGVYEEKMEYTIFISGVNEQSNSVTLRVRGFTPYFYVKVPNEWGESQGKRLFEHLKFMIWKESYGLAGFDLVKRKQIFPYNRGIKCKFIRLIFTTDKAFNRCKWIFIKQDEKPIKVPTIGTKVYETFDTNIPHINRFCHISKVSTTSWINLNKFDYEEGFSNSQINVSSHWKNIKQDENMIKISPFTIVGWDIECLPENTEEFPNHEIIGDEIKLISAVVNRFGEEYTEKYLFVSGKCSEINGVKIIYARNEKQLIQKFVDFLCKVDFDFISGYNTWNFDDKYLWARAYLYSIDISDLSRVKNFNPRLDSKNLSSSAYGDNKFTYIYFPGRETFDLIESIRREHKLVSYSLDNVANHFLSQNKVEMPIRQLFEKLKKGDPDEVAECGHYCVEDSNLVIKLILKLNLFSNNIEMAKTTFVPIDWLLFRGQQCKVFSLLSKKAREHKFVFQSKLDTFNGDFKGATVLTAKIGLHYYGVCGLDFASLYPSIMIAYNIDYTTYINDQETMEYVKNNGIPYETIEWSEEDDHGNINHFSYSFVQYKDNEGNVYEKGFQGLLPQILDELWIGRKTTKKQMNLEKELFMKAVLYGKQLAQKVTMNSIYGFTGPNNGIFPLKPLAASVTAIGRKMIELTSNIVRDKFGAETIYGDSIPGWETVVVNGKNITIKKLSEDTNVPWLEYRGFKIGDLEIKNKEYKNTEGLGLFADTEKGPQPIKKIIRHETNKKLYRITAKDSDGKLRHVTVTEGHSLIGEYGSLIKAQNLHIGHKLFKI